MPRSCWVGNLCAILLPGSLSLGFCSEKVHLSLLIQGGSSQEAKDEGGTDDCTEELNPIVSASPLGFLEREETRVIIVWGNSWRGIF